jgi:hypothetical protein
METGAPRSPASGRTMVRKSLWAAAWLIGGFVLALIFLAYRQPGLLIDFVNLRYCG